MTAEIGAMRIAEEIDATEALGLRAVTFVVETRLLGGMLIVVPGYAAALLVSFFTPNTMIKLFYYQPGGTYDHYFIQSLSPIDLTYSMAKAITFCAGVTIIHCYYGYFASGGQVGIRLASGRAARAA